MTMVLAVKQISVPLSGSLCLRDIHTNRKTCPRRQVHKRIEAEVGNSDRAEDR